MSFAPKNNYQVLKSFQLRVDLNSPRFASKIPSSQEEARSIIANSDHIISLMSSIEKNGILEPLIVFERSTGDIDKYEIVEGVRRYVCLLELKDKYLKDKKPFPIHFTRVPCLIKEKIEAREYSVHMVGHKEWDPALIAKLLAHYKNTDLDRFNQYRQMFRMSLGKAENEIYSYELMEKYKDYFDSKLNKNYKSKTGPISLFSYFSEYVKIKNSVRWYKEEQFVEDLAKGKITHLRHIRYLSRCKRNKKLIEFYKKVKTTDEFERLVFEQFKDDGTEIINKNFEKNSNNLDYFARKKLQFQSVWEEAVVLYRELNYRDSKEKEKKLDELDKENEKEKPEIIIKLSAYEEFEYFKKTIEADDKCFESKEFNKEIVKGFKANSLNESSKNDFINLLATKFFEFFYKYEKQSKLYDFCFKKETNQPISFYLRKGKLSSLNELEIIKELATNKIVLDEFTKNDAASVLKKLEIFKSTDSNSEKSNDQKNQKIDMIYEMINAHESKLIELKSSFSRNLQTNQSKDPIVRFQVLKTVNAFVNSVGGSLIIGVTDQGEIIGIENDDYESEDKYKRLIDDILKSSLKSENSLLWDVEIINLPKEKKKICFIKCDRAPELISLYYQKYNEAWNKSKQGENKKIALDKTFYFKRDAAGSTEMQGETLLNYDRNRRSVQ